MNHKYVTLFITAVCMSFFSCTIHSNESSNLGHNFVNDMCVEICLVRNDLKKKVILTLDGRDVTEIVHPPVISKDMIKGVYVCRIDVNSKKDLMILLDVADDKICCKLKNDGYTVGIMVNGKLKHIMFVNTSIEDPYFSIGCYSKEELIGMLGKDKAELIDLTIHHSKYYGGDLPSIY